jgi:hypothetical protein
MTLSKYIKALQKIKEKEGGKLILYTALDDEGNGFSKVFCSPEVRLLSHHEDQCRPDHLCTEKEIDEEDDWHIDANRNDKKVKRVVLL